MLSFRSVAAAWVPLANLNVLESLRVCLTNEINGMEVVKLNNMNDIKKMLLNTNIGVSMENESNNNHEAEYDKLIESIRGLFAEDKDTLNSEGLVKQSIFPELKNLGLGYSMNMDINAIRMLTYKKTYSQLEFSLDDGPETDLSPNMSINRLESIFVDASTLHVDVDDNVELGEKDDILVCI